MPAVWWNIIQLLHDTLNAPFDPDPVTPCSTGTTEAHHRPVHRQLSHRSSKEDDDTHSDETPSPDSTPPVQHQVDTFKWLSSKYTMNLYINLEEEEKDFPNSLTGWLTLGYVMTSPSLKTWWLHPVMKTSLHSRTLDTKVDYG